MPPGHVLVFQPDIFTPHLPYLKSGSQTIKDASLFSNILTGHCLEKRNAKTQTFLANALEFFGMWLFLDSVNFSHLHWFNNLKNIDKMDLTFIIRKL